MIDANMISTITETEANFRLTSKQNTHTVRSVVPTTSASPINKNAQIAAAAKAAASKQTAKTSQYVSARTSKPSNSYVRPKVTQKTFMQKLKDFFN